MTRGQNKPLPKPYRTPGRIRFNLFQGICYHKMSLNFKFHVNQSINKDFITSGHSYPLPEPYHHPVEIGLIYFREFVIISYS